MADDKQTIEREVRARFAAVAREPGAERVFPVGPESAKRLGYDPAEVEALPARVSESFAGVGNPLALAPWAPGLAVLDVGCGAGFDSLLAARRVGPTGRVIGLDMTPEMVEKASANARLAGAANVAFRLAHADALPLEDGTIDVVITNGVFNLCADKPAVVREFHRVLRPGGSLRMADILLEPHMTPEGVASKGAWSD